VCVLIVGSSIGRVKPKIIQLMFVASPQSTQSVKLEQRLIVKIICPSGGTFLLISGLKFL
jgi:hypothetical protein